MLRVFVSYEQYEVDLSSSHSEFEFLALLSGLVDDTIGVFEVCDMILLISLVLSGEINGLMAVGLLRYAGVAFVDHPRLIPIPDGPVAVLNMKITLESFSQSVLHRIILYGEC